MSPTRTPFAVLNGKPANFDRSASYFYRCKTDTLYLYTPARSGPSRPAPSAPPVVIEE